MAGDSDTAMPGMDHSKHPMSRTFSFGHPGSAASVERSIAIVMNDMSFSPNSIEVKAGETIKFVVTNKSDTDHELTLGDTPIQIAHRQEIRKMAETGMVMHHHGDTNAISVEPGKTAELIWTFTKATTIEFDCNIPGHYEAGMKGTIVIR